MHKKLSTCLVIEYWVILGVSNGPKKLVTWFLYNCWFLLGSLSTSLCLGIR